MDPSDLDPYELSNSATDSNDGPTHAAGRPATDGRWMRSVVEHSSEIVTVVDPDGTLRYANPAWQRLLSYDPEVAIGTMNVLDHVHPEDLAHVLEETERALAEGGVAASEAEYRFRRKDGSWLWMESVGTYLLDDPAVGGVVVVSRDVTERKAAEERLRFQARLLDTVGEAVIALDVDGRVSYWNRAAEDLYGWSSDEAMDSKLRDLVVSDDLRGRAEEIAGQLREGRAWTGEFMVRRKDGTTFPVEGTGTPVLGEDGGLIGVIGVLRDVTERKETEEALRWSEAELFSVLESITDAFFALDRELRFAYVNPQAAVLFSTRREDLIGEKVWKDPTFYPQYERAMTEGRTVAFEGYYPPSGAWYSVRAYPSGSGLSVYLQDVSGRKEAEIRLRESEQRYRTLVEQIPAVTYIDPVSDPDTSLYTSPHIEELLGYTPEEWRTQKLWPKRLHPDDRVRVLAADERFEKGGGGRFEEEYRLLAKDGTVVWVREEAVLVKNAEDKPLYWQGVIYDITERKATEEALRKNEERLGSLADAAFEGILITDGGEILEANRALVAMLGYESHEVVGRSALGFVAPEYRNLVRRKIDSGDEDPYEIVGVTKGGGCLDLEVRGRAYSYRGRSVRVTAVRDVTERKAAEERLRETEERYRTLVERLPAVTFVDRADGSEESLYVSPQVEKMLGYTPEEWMAGRLWRESLHPEDRGRILASDEHFEADGEPVDEEYRLLAKDGTVVWVREETVLVRGSGGEPLFVQGIMSDVTEKKRYEERLHHQAFHDFLTGLPNRRLFIDRLGHALRRTRREQDRVAVLFMDLDGFKVVNDSLGHDTGDRLLVEAAKRLSSCLRPQDTLARFGGDEFVVLVEDVGGADDAAQLAERIVAVLREPFTLDDRELYVAASIGVGLGGDSTRDPEELLSEADTSMYRAKDEGSGFRIFDPAMHGRGQAVYRLELENDLRRAVEENEFVVHYQPIVDLRTGAVWGVEALVRWDHPERGLIHPDEFVPVAEETGLVVPMGELVLGETCRRAVEWQREFPHTPPLAMFVNLSGRQFRRPDLPEIIGQALAETGLPATSLGLDITESVYIGALDANTAGLDRLKDLGIRFSLDDFGSGYSSLSYLKRLPADILKIDKSFTKGLGVEVEDTAIVQTVVDLAHILGMEVVAEGVEIEEQETLLKEMGCDFGQGFYFSKPLPPETASEFLDSTHQSSEPPYDADSLSDSK